MTKRIMMLIILITLPVILLGTGGYNNRKTRYLNIVTRVKLTSVEVFQVRRPILRLTASLPISLIIKTSNKDLNPFFYSPKAFFKARQASNLVESRVGRGQSAGLTIRGISVQPKTTPSHPFSFNSKITSLKYNLDVSLMMP